jgi:hypothetical protein
VTRTVKEGEKTKIRVIERERARGKVGVRARAGAGARVGARVVVEERVQKIPKRAMQQPQAASMKLLRLLKGSRRLRHSDEKEKITRCLYASIKK